MGALAAIAAVTAGGLPAIAGARGAAQSQAPESSAPERLHQAAKSLLESGDAAAIRDAILGDSASHEMVAALARAAAQADAPPDEAVLEAMADRLAYAQTQAEARALLDALARASNKAAVQACVDALQAEAFPAADAEVVACLISLTGRQDLGADAQAWIAWWESARWLPEAEWRSRLARWRGERARRLERERDEAHARLAAALREMHARLPESERADRLAALLRDDWAVVRQVGLELAERDLLNARAIAPNVVEGALENLTHADVRVRRAAAALLARVPNSGAAAAARAALTRETDPAAAAALLRLAARDHTPEARQAATAWLERDDAGEARESAAGLLLAAAKAGALDAPALRSRAAAALRGRGVAALGPVEWELLLELGSEADRQRLLRLARAPSQAGESTGRDRLGALWMILAKRPDTARHVLDSDPATVPAAAVVEAARSVGEPTAVIDLLARSERASSAEEAQVWREAAAQVCLTISPEAARAAHEQAGDGFRLALLRAATDGGAAGHALLRSLFNALVDAAIRAGEMELAARAGEALASAAATPAPAEADDAARARAASVVAALAAGERVEAAARFSGDAQTWLAALRQAEERDWPADVVERLARFILERFSDALTSDEAQWVRSLRQEPGGGQPRGNGGADAPG